MDNSTDNIEELYKEQLLWSKPIVYKDITLYPVRCEYLVNFYSSIQVLLYDPIRYPTEVSTLPRLYFLTDIINHQNDAVYLQQNPMLQLLLTQLAVLFNLVLGENQKFTFNNHNGNWFIRVTNEDGKEVDVKVKDFEEIRKLILHQNGIDYDDTFIHEDIRKWIAEQEAKEDKTPATIEDYLDAFILSAHIADENIIKQVSIRRFNRIIEKSLMRENYDIQKTASMSGFVTFKGEIEHWLHIEKKNVIFNKYFKELNTNN